MTINAQLLKQTLAHIEANPSEWDQKQYRCGTGLCFAGWAVQLAGGRWYSDNADAALGEALIAEPGEARSFAPESDSSVRLVHAEFRAEQVLGLSDDQAGRLFYAGNTLPDLRLIVAELCEEAA
ncbi:hypothetical protein [Nonomuraea sp. KM90]|uniref:hypothetical protein n=1 Tax=Nonomuraea sp. KM90 TaxID=3457428 RepID=UPI003FCCB22E